LHDLLVFGIERTNSPPNHLTGLLASETLKMQRQDEREIRELLVKLRLEHRDLDSEIAMLEASASADQLQISRLKRRKLKLKDQISDLEDRLLPDIIA
jgi:hypothetical protein